MTVTDPPRAVVLLVNGTMRMKSTGGSSNGPGLSFRITSREDWMLGKPIATKRTLPVSATAIGASFTLVTVMVMVEVVESAGLPLSVPVTTRFTMPKKFVAGENWSAPLGRIKAVPEVAAPVIANVTV